LFLITDHLPLATDIGHWPLDVGHCHPVTTCYHPRALNIRETPLPGVFLIEPKVFTDERGFFMETYNLDAFRTAGITDTFVQDNHSRSARGVLRGLHYQEPNAQGKLVRCTRGAIFDVAVDIRRGSPSFAKWFGLELSDANKLMLWIPPGFAHGFCALEGDSDLVYKCTTLYDQPSDRCILWNDPEIGIEWPIGEPVLSEKDSKAPRLADATVLPRYS
jgi:dTDP-4-dehydrorhamnose 3,5-epimerase